MIYNIKANTEIMANPDLLKALGSLAMGTTYCSCSNHFLIFEKKALMELDDSFVKGGYEVKHFKVPSELKNEIELDKITPRKLFKGVAEDVAVFKMICRIFENKHKDEFGSCIALYTDGISSILWDDGDLIRYELTDVVTHEQQEKILADNGIDIETDKEFISILKDIKKDLLSNDESDVQKEVEIPSEVRDAIDGMLANMEKESEVEKIQDAEILEEVASLKKAADTEIRKATINTNIAIGVILLIAVIVFLRMLLS